jgi:succinate dehydrogenase / fumarate reductase membrane anchor subunit
MKSIHMLLGDHGNHAREATVEWLRQRFSSLLLIPLTPWVILTYALQSPRNHGQFVAWMIVPAHYLPLAIFFSISVYHAWLGMKVIIDDYVHDPVLHGLSLTSCRMLLAGIFGIATLALLILVF